MGYKKSKNDDLTVNSLAEDSLDKEVLEKNGQMAARNIEKHDKSLASENQEFKVKSLASENQRLKAKSLAGENKQSEDNSLMVENILNKKRQAEEKPNTSDKYQAVENRTGAGDSAESQIENLIAALGREDFLEEYIYNNPEINETIINRYLLGLKGRKQVPMLGGGMGQCAIAPVKKPRTLDEAKRIADIFLR